MTVYVDFYFEDSEEPIWHNLAVTNFVRKILYRLSESDRVIVKNPDNINDNNTDLYSYSDKEFIQRVWWICFDYYTSRDSHNYDDERSEWEEKFPSDKLCRMTFEKWVVDDPEYQVSRIEGTCDFLNSLGMPRKWIIP